MPRPPWLLVLAALVCVGLVAWWAASQRGRSFDPQQLIETQLQAAEKATQPTGSVHFMKPRRLTVGSGSAGFFSKEALIPGPTVLDRGVGLTVGGGPPGVMGVMGG